METQLPALPPGPCNTGTTLVMVARCVEGVWELGWADATEIGDGLRAGGGCAKKAAIKMAGELKWTADELVKVLKTL